MSGGLDSADVTVAPEVWIDRSARLFGAITIGSGSSIWPYAVARAEVNDITIGRCSNIQDFVMLHIGFAHALRIGDYCSITHRATLHGCIVEDYCLIGIGATIMDGCVIGRGSIVAGHAYLKENTLIPPFSIVMGAPGAVTRQRDCLIGKGFIGRVFL